MKKYINILRQIFRINFIHDNKMNYLYKGDLPNDLELPSAVAVDTETMGLNFSRDKLCLVQISLVIKMLI